jgi:hypothetical protein
MGDGRCTWHAGRASGTRRLRPPEIFAHAEEANSYGEKMWDNTNHNLDLIFERDGVAYGVEVKNTLGYLDIEEFLTKIRLVRHIGVKPVFAVRALPPLG